MENENQTSPTNNAETDKQYISKWIVILLLFLFPPIGLIIVLAQKRYHSWLPHLLWISASSFLVLFAVTGIFLLPPLKKLYNNLNIPYPVYTDLVVAGFTMLLIVQIIFGFSVRKEIKLKKILSKTTLIIATFFFITNYVFEPAFYVSTVGNSVYKAISLLQEQQNLDKIVSQEKTSPDGSFTVSEGVSGDYNMIKITNSQGLVITSDLIAKNYPVIGYNVKFQCQCGTSFKGWVNNTQFAIKIRNGMAEEYEYLVDAGSGSVIESSFRKMK